MSKSEWNCPQGSAQFRLYHPANKTAGLVPIHSFVILGPETRRSFHSPNDDQLSPVSDMIQVTIIQRRIMPTNMENAMLRIHKQCLRRYIYVWRRGRRRKAEKAMLKLSLKEWVGGIQQTTGRADHAGHVINA